MRIKSWLLIASAFSTLAVMQPSAHAIEAAKVPPSKHTSIGRYLDAREAYELKQKLGDKAFFVDVRTRYEVTYVGMPTVADANIAYAEHPAEPQWDDKAGRFKMELNSAFPEQLAQRMKAKGLGKDDVVILLCRSGDRSARATNLLAQLGYSNVYTVIDGFEGDAAPSGPQQGQRVVNGWKNAGLPWTYKLEREKVIFPSR